MRRVARPGEPVGSRQHGLGDLAADACLRESGLRSASEMNGVPAASFTFACAVTCGGTAGFSSIPFRNDAVSAAISSEPASAVPIEAPRLVAVFCRPPTSGLCRQGRQKRSRCRAARRVRRCRGRRRGSGTVTISASASTSMAQQKARRSRRTSPADRSARRAGATPSAGTGECRPRRPAGSVTAEGS